VYGLARYPVFQQLREAHFALGRRRCSGPSFDIVCGLRSDGQCSNERQPRSHTAQHCAHRGMITVHGKIS
jgi:hypothetical protein